MTLITPKAFKRAALALSGEVILVRIRQPVYQGVSGCAYKTPQGKAVIDLNPDLEGDRLLLVFLEEVAHVTLGHCQPGDWSDRPSGSLPLALASKVDSLPREDQAKRQALTWLEYARKNARTPDLEGQLQALAGWIRPDLQALITKVVKECRQGRW